MSFQLQVLTRSSCPTPSDCIRHTSMSMETTRQSRGGWRRYKRVCAVMAVGSICYAEAFRMPSATSRAGVSSRGGPVCLTAQSDSPAPTSIHAGDANRPKQNVTLLNGLKPGLKLKGGVVGVTTFAAFLDVHVVRKGREERLVRCNALLHPADLLPGYTLLPDNHPMPSGGLETKIIRKGIHVPVYVKDVFPNSGRFSVTMDPTVSKETVVASRQEKRMASKNRGKVKAVQVEGGTEKSAKVIKALRRGFLVDVGLGIPAFLGHAHVPGSIPIEDVAKPGAVLRVRIMEKDKSDKQVKCELLSLA